MQKKLLLTESKRCYEFQMKSVFIFNVGSYIRKCYGCLQPQEDAFFSWLTGHVLCPVSIFAGRSSSPSLAYVIHPDKNHVVSCEVSDLSCLVGDCRPVRGHNLAETDSSQFYALLLLILVSMEGTTAQSSSTGMLTI